MSVQSLSDPDNKTQLEGTLLVVLAACIFALVALVVKTDPMPLLLATECRFLVSWVVAISFMLMYKKERGLFWFGPAELRLPLLMKCASSFCFILLWWKAIKEAPVGDCIAIIYTSPILTSILSRIFLAEILPPQFPMQMLLVCAGVVLVLNPPILHDAGSEATNMGDYKYIFLALGFCAFVPVFTRQAKDCSWIEVEHVSACLASTLLCPSCIALDAWRSGSDLAVPTAKPHEIFLICLAALGSFVGIAMETKGYQLAEVGKASMFRYVEVPFAYFLQLVGTNEPVKAQAIFGSVLIIASCFLGLWRLPARSSGLEEAKESLLNSPGSPWHSGKP